MKGDAAPFLEDLTVFVISSGEETFDQCIAALKNQDSTFHIHHIEGVVPMSAAFQAMPDHCKTRYFLQVDADMILYPATVQMLYLSTQNSPFWIYRVSASLYEEGFGIGGAVKCWKTNTFRFSKFHDVRTVDRDLHNRLRRVGLRTKHLDTIAGIHRPRHSSFSRYLKTKSDTEKWRFLQRPSPLFSEPLLETILNKDNCDGHRLLGILLGSLTPYSRLGQSKNVIAERELFDRVTTILSQTQELSMIACSTDTKESLHKEFVAAYSDFYSKDYSSRLALAVFIERIFVNSKDRAQSLVNRLIEAIDE